jgi:hypothetical protein
MIPSDDESSYHVRSYNIQGEALDNNCQKCKKLKLNNSAKCLPVLLVNEMNFKKMQHRGL